MRVKRATEILLGALKDKAKKEDYNIDENLTQKWIMVCNIQLLK